MIYINNIDDYCLNHESTIIDGLKALNAVEIKLAIVVDDNGSIIRTLSDGDIRRAMVSGFALDTKLVELKFESPITVPFDANENEVKSLMATNNVQTIVKVDEVRAPVSIVASVGRLGFTYLSPPHLGSNEIQYFMDAIEDNWVAPVGPNLQKFEKDLAQIVDKKHACAVASGTAAIHLALRAIGVNDGDRVYVSDLTFVASLQPILYQRAEPVLIDCEPDTWNMSPEALGRALEFDNIRNSLPKAIVLVHIYGQLADIEKISSIATEYGIPIIEDAAESLGATYDSNVSANKSLITTVSFNGNKIITTSSGGAVLTDDEELDAKIRHLATQGRDRAEHYQHSEIAYNYRMSNLLAGIGIGQLEVLGDRVQRRVEIFNRYKNGFSNVKGVSFQNETKGSRGNRWLTVLKFDPDLIQIHPYKLLRQLKSYGIETRPCWKPMHLQPLCKHFEFFSHSKSSAVSTEIYFTSLCMPSGSAMNDVEVDFVIEKTLEILN